MIKDKLHELLKSSSIYLDNDIFDYGYKIFITYLKYLICILPLSILFDILIEVSIFIILFIPIRRFIGGFHFKNLNHCFFGSVLMAVTLPYIALHIQIPFAFTAVIIFITLISTSYIGVVDNINKRLNKKEIKIHTKKTLKIEALYTCFIIVTYYLDVYYISTVIQLIFIFCIGGLYISKFLDK